MGDQISVNDFRNGRFIVSINVKEAQKHQFRIFDLGGKQVGATQVKDLPAGKSSIRFNKSGLADGMYLLEIRNYKQKFVQKIVIQN